MLSWEGTLSLGLSDAGKATLAFSSVQPGGIHSPDANSRISWEELAFLNIISRPMFDNVSLTIRLLSYYPVFLLVSHSLNSAKVKVVTLKRRR